MVILPEFGRDPDGSSTMVLQSSRQHGFNSGHMDDGFGVGVDKPQIVERPIRHIDLCQLLRICSVAAVSFQGAQLKEFHG